MYRPCAKTAGPTKNDETSTATEENIPDTIDLTVTGAAGKTDAQTQVDHRKPPFQDGTDPAWEQVVN